MSDDLDTGTAAQADAGTADDQGAVAAAVDSSTDAPATWNYAEGIPGQGEQPDWFKADKYGSVVEQAKAYVPLEGRFGAFTGAPEEFTVSISEDLAERGLEIDAEDPLVQSAMEFAKKSNMNQEGFDEMVNLVGMVRIAENDAAEEFKQDEIKALGDNASTRISNLVKWAGANLPEDMIDGFNNMAQSAASVKTMERLVAMTRSAPIDPGGETVVTGISEEEVKAMQFELDEYGNRRLHTDKAFAAKFKKLSQQVWGTEDHRVIVS